MPCPAASWFPKELQRVFEDDFVPTTQDILQARVMTMSIHQFDIFIPEKKINLR